MEVPVVVPVPVPIPGVPSVVAPVLPLHPSWKLPCAHEDHAVLLALAPLPWLLVLHPLCHLPLPEPA